MLCVIIIIYDDRVERSKCVHACNDNILLTFLSYDTKKDLQILPKWYELKRMKIKPKSVGDTKENGLSPEELEDIRYMKAALSQAKKAYKLGEVPIGCVIVYEGQIIGRGYNRRNTDKTALAHAEITAIKKATRFMKDWRLEECRLYVTLEPCQMCAGAIVQARIPKVIMAAENPKAGCAGSVMDILNNPDFNHQVDVKKGVLKEECSKVLKDFFVELRARNKAEKEQKGAL